jgi:hypothetical protein
VIDDSKRASFRPTEGVPSKARGLQHANHRGAAGITIATLFALACGTLGTGASPPQASQDDTFFAVDAEIGMPIEHAQVYLVGTMGVTLFAEADSQGLIRGGPLDEVFASEVKALLVCAEGYYCGGWLVADLDVHREEGVRLFTITLASVRLH